MSTTVKGIIYVLMATVLWSTGGLFIKKVPADPLLISGVRSAVAGLALLPFLRLKEIRFNKYLLGYFLAFPMLMITFVTATKLTSAANAIALQYTAPIYLFLFNLVTGKEKPVFRNTAPMVLIVVGIGIFLREPSQGTSFLGNLLALASGVAFAASAYFVRQINTASPMGLVSISNLAAAVLILPFAPVGQIFTIDTAGLFSLFYLGAFQIGLANVSYVNGLRYMEPLRATVLALAEAVLNPIWVFFFIGEAPSSFALIGSVFILGAIVLDVYLRLQPASLEDIDLSA